METKLRQILIVRGSILNEATIEQLEYKAQKMSVQIQYFDSTDSNIDKLLELDNQSSSSGSETSNKEYKDQIPVFNVDCAEQLATALIQDTELTSQKNHGNYQRTNLPFHENIHRNQLLWYSFQEYLTQNEIDLVVFLATPEGLNESVLYQVAKVLDIFVLILCQSPFCERFFSFSSLDDCGNYDKTAELSVNIWNQIEENPTERKSQHSQIRCQGSNSRSVLQICRFLFQVRSIKIFNPFYILKHAKHLHDAPANVSNWKDSYARFFYCPSVAYFEFFSRGHTDKFDSNDKYVYFPIQSLAELHSEILISQFGDQLLALEQLVSMLPENYKVVIKSDSRRDSDYLTPMFFHRVRRIKNVVRLPSCTEAEQLIDNSEFVATVSSGDGWKALSRGKKVLVFGSPWYRRLPGAYEYRDDIKYIEITEPEFSISEFQRQVNCIHLQSHTGQLNSAATNDGIDKDEFENATQVATTILELILGHKNPTFQS